MLKTMLQQMYAIFALLVYLCRFSGVLAWNPPSNLCCFGLPFWNFAAKVYGS